jgi:hypothetical protein
MIGDFACMLHFMRFDLIMNFQRVILVFRDGSGHLLKTYTGSHPYTGGTRWKNTVEYQAEYNLR